MAPLPEQYTRIKPGDFLSNLPEGSVPIRIKTHATFPETQTPKPPEGKYFVFPFG